MYSNLAAVLTAVLASSQIVASAPAAIDVRDPMVPEAAAAGGHPYSGAPFMHHPAGYGESEEKKPHHGAKNGHEIAYPGVKHHPLQHHRKAGEKKPAHHAATGHKGNKDNDKEPEHHKAAGHKDAAHHASGHAPAGYGNGNADFHPHRAAAAPPVYSTALPTDFKAPGRPYIGKVLHHHNVHRANHSAPALKWSLPLAKTAAKIAASCTFAHNVALDGGGYGQNIAAGVDNTGLGRIISDMFYNGEINAFGNQYGVEQPTGFESWGHFTQVVWKGTDSVGCYTKYCPAGLGNVGGNVPPWFTVCNYAGPGNYYGEYADNVGTPLGKPTVTGSG